jgi:hypothetical protein
MFGSNGGVSYSLENLQDYYFEDTNGNDIVDNLVLINTNGTVSRFNVNSGVFTEFGDE